MSPKHSDYRSEEFEFEQDHDFSYRRSSESGDSRGTPRPTNAPARKAGSRKVKGAHNGMQRRRNKHWSW